MKNRFFRILAAVLTVALAFAVTACKDGQTYVLKFFVDGAEHASVQTGGNEVITLPEKPSKDGYEFDGWYFDDGTFEDEFSASSLLGVTLTADITVYAKWKKSTPSTESLMSAFLYESVTGGYKITGVAHESATSITVPGEVVSISRGAFEACRNLTSLTVPFVGESRGAEGDFAKMDYVFGEEAPISLKKITVTEKADIPEKAFYGMSFVEEIVYENGSKNIGKSAFYNCKSLKEFDISEECESIGNLAFCNCYDIGELIIPAGVKTIGSSAFKGMKLAEITLPTTLEALADEAFRETNLTAIKVSAGNAHFKSVDGVLYSKDGKKLIAYPTAKTDMYFTVPDGTEEICTYAFYNCESLCSITVPDSVTGVGKYALNCTALVYLEAATLGEGFKSFWRGFSNEYVLDCNNNDVAEDGNRYVIQNNIRFRLTDLHNMAYVCSYQSTALTGASIPEAVVYKGNSYSVVEISLWAFKNCAGITEITVPASVEEIRGNAFENCVSLRSVVIGTGCSYVSQTAFIGCSVLERVQFLSPDGWSVDDEPIDVSDSELNATRLADGYYTAVLRKE